MPFVTSLLLRARHAIHRRLPRGDAGYTTEVIVVTAVLVTIALAVLAILGAKILDKANSIDLG